MDDRMSDDDERRAGPDGRPQTVARRTLVGAAAWSIPAIALSATTPATAASAGASLHVVFDEPDQRPTGGDLSDGRAVLVGADGKPVAGETIVLRVSGPAFFGAPGVTQRTVTTDASGTARATDLTAGTAAGTVTLTATVSGIAPASATRTVVPAFDIAVVSAGGPTWPFLQGPGMTISGQPAYRVNGTYTFRSVIRNAGSVPLPAGSLLTYTFGRISIGGATIVSAIELVGVGADGAAIGLTTGNVVPTGPATFPGGTDGIKREYRVDAPIPAGASFTLEHSAHIPNRLLPVRTSNGQVLVEAAAVGAPGSDPNAGNNRTYGPLFATYTM
ncbi:hypothetical protein DEI86_07690 [Curtobacterium sp. MCBD17_028]|nr:hypothetical protein DEI86_07690 [Curtobacterium sp. MCBD17_028]